MFNTFSSVGVNAAATRILFAKARQMSLNENRITMV
jgi:hypothetical protein